MSPQNFRILQIVKDDPWLEPAAADVYARYQRYQERLRHIEKAAGSLSAFADAYQYFGITRDPVRKGWIYREWAPKAHALFLKGDFNNWNPYSHPLAPVGNGVWEIYIDGDVYKRSFVHGSRIKIVVEGGGQVRDRIPAYIRRVVQDDRTKDFSGQVWLPGKFNWENDRFDAATLQELFIYECHVGMAEEREGIGTYNEFTDNVLPRIKNAGYNAIQMMAIQEHPYYGSFGYHVSNFFAPSSRFGTPEDLMNLIKTAHRMGIAVIMDIVHSHTVKNLNEGLNEFDGSDHQYFHPGGRGEHPGWDSKLFDYGKWEVLQFLLSNLKYWMKEFHFDGFRFDGVGSMMYFHHGNDVIDSRDKYFNEGVEWDAVTYLQLANKLIHTINKHAVVIAEDVTGMPGLCKPIPDGGIGFDYRLGMGIPDFWIKYLKEKRDEEWNIHEMWNVLNDRVPGVRTVSYAESHDQALVGDKTLAFWLMDKEMYWHMHKDDPDLVIDRGMALHKMIRLFTIALGGQAYLNFMGNEFGHPEWIDFPREGNNWSYRYARRQWSLVDDPNLKYQFLASFDREMIRIIRENRVLNWEFARELHMDDENRTIVFERNGLVFVFNWHPSNSITDYTFTVPEPGKYRIILNTDNQFFGGHGRIDESVEHFSYFDGIWNVNRLKIYITNRTAVVLKKL
ncbi:MAG TPA: alpha amylase C-terminal domain-containing protein [Bacteroidales bacterium]|nr:alpha amylase C-terminal domain-containing protein [Bacteroidales bacterium]